MPLAIEEILGRLNINGGTNVGGGSAYANYVVVTGASGTIDPSLVTSSLSSYTNTSEPDIDNVIAEALTPKVGEIAVTTSGKVYLRTSLYDWTLVAYNSAAATPYVPSTIPLDSTNVKDAIDELATTSVRLAYPSTVTSLVTFNNSGAPFAVGAGSAGNLVADLTAQYLGASGQDAAYFKNAANLTGTIASDRLNGVYANLIAGSTQTAHTADTATNALACSGNSATATTAAACSGNSATATLATNATNLLDSGSTPRPGSYYLDAANLTGTLSAGHINDSAHGSLGGANLHALATPSVAGFMSAADKEKLNGLTASLFTGLKIDATVVNPDNSGVTNFVAGSGITLTPTAGSNTITFALDPTTAFAASATPIQIVATDPTASTGFVLDANNRYAPFLTSNDGTRYVIAVSNSGALSTTPLS
jgi:hypothetical protein